MLRSKIFLFLIGLFLATDLFASHYMGGEITWQCLNNGRFRFIMKLYRECNGITYSSTETITVTNGPIASITMNLFPGGNAKDGLDGTLDGKTDLSPDCWNFGQEIHCSPSPSSANTGAVEEWYFTSDASYPNGVQLNGTPPATGWIFSHTSCCRNPCTNITNASGLSWFLRAIMYPYNGAPTFPCYDNSPAFAEVPSTVICTAYPFTYNHNAADKELDSLVYSWAQALDGSINTPVSYAPGYTYNSPLPGPAQNPNNIAATMNPFTGEISYLSFTAGAFVTVTKVAAYRCGIKIAEIFREMQIVLLNCPGTPNHQPNVSAPFYNPITGLYDLYIDTVMAGDVVDFDIVAQDADLLPNGNPNTVFLETSSQDYGTGYTDPNNGCVNPPCAMLNPAPPLSGMVAVATHFHWQTGCNHINFNVGCANLSNVHNFYFKIFDNGCPANAINGVTVTIVVVAPPILAAPVPHCTEVLPNGDVVLTWENPPDPTNTFDSYHLYSSSSLSGPFTRIDSIFDSSQTTYTHVGAGANLGPRYYYMRTRSGCFGKFFSPQTSDTVATMYLDVSTTGLGMVASLNWNPVHAPPLPSSLGWYRIYREFPPGSWTLLDSVQTLSYFDTVIVCNDFLNYRIEIGDTLGCTSISSVDGTLLADQFAPDMPVLDSVSVDLVSGYAVIGWEPTLAPDTRMYYIFHRTAITPWNIIDSTVGRFNTYYVDSNSSPQTGSEYYRVKAIDSCGHPSQWSVDQRTVYIDSLNIDVCADQISLSWNNYIHWDTSLFDGYLVYASENGPPFMLLANITDTSVLTYDHTNLTLNAHYCYYIKAYRSDGVYSTSNVKCIDCKKPNQPEYVFMRYATVVDNEYARVGFFIDTTAYISKIKLQRSEDGANFDELATIPPHNLYSTISYDDLSARVTEKPYYYRVIVIDSCGVEVLTSNLARTIYLYGNADTYMINHLEWTPYEDRDPQVYNIFREIEDYNKMHRAFAVQWGDIVYEDDVSMWTETSGRFDYMIEAALYDIYEQRFPFADTVYSNKILLIQEPRVYIPNAFTPNGLNPIFKPVGVFVDASDYYFAIYSRWGEKLFETTDVSAGWDGFYDGKICQMGSYTYYVHFKLSNGKDYKKRGSVVLVR